VALINSLTTKPKLNVSNIKSPFGSGSSIPKISAGAGSFINRSSTPIKPAKMFDAGRISQIQTNVSVADDLSSQESGINAIAGQLSEITAVIKDIGGALALDFANRIANQQQDNKALKAQASADRRSSAESNLEGSKKIGKGIGSGLGTVGKAATGLTLGGIMDAAKLLGAGVAINALWPQIEKIFDWTIENFNKILLVGGGLLALNVIGGIGTLLKFAKFFLSPKILAAMAILYAGYQIGKPIFKARTDADESKRDKLIEEGVDPGKAEQLVQGTRTPDAGGSGSINHLRNKTFNPTAIPGDFDYRSFHDGGIVTGTTQEVPAILERGEAVIPKELVAALSQKPGINLIEMDLPPIRIPPKEKKVAMEETTTVNAISSINVLNPYMSKTPELHGILV
tara:strand:- start:209 stop:1402 length:1194 start_codon:yes stop_codon:yes gene_type:complete